MTKSLKDAWRSPKFVAGVFVALFFATALCFRVLLPYPAVFGSDWIKYTGIDPYYNMRLVDNLLQNFPHHMSIDPYHIFPGATGEISIRFFVWLLAGVTWLIGLGSPSPHTIDVVGVYFPAVLGALAVIPVYFIGKTLVNRWAGVLGAGLIAIMPGEFLGRSILGFTDYHVAETLFTAITMMFLIMAVKSASQRQITFANLRDWRISKRPVIYSLLAGLFLGIYLLTWLGALLFVFIIAVYFVVQFIIDHLQGRSTDYLGIAGVVVFLTALIVFQLIPASLLYQASLIIAVLAPLALSALSRLMAAKKIKPAYYPLAVVVVSAIGMGLLRLVNAALFDGMLRAFSIFSPQGASLTTMEMQPLLFPGGSFTLSLAWGNFTTGFFFSIISLCFLLYFVIKRGEADKTALIVWTLVIAAATLGQRRFAYYLAVNVAVLTGYISWLALEKIGFKKAASAPEGAVHVEKRLKHKKSRQGTHPIRTVNMVLAVIVLFFFVFFWNIMPAKVTAEAARFAPSDAWCSSMTWLKDNTPEPFGNPDAYYNPPPSAAPGPTYVYPKSAYGVLSWWDYGYLISRIAHRIPNANPSQDPVALNKVANFFTATDETAAINIAKELGSAYVVIDFATANTKFYAMAIWANKPQSQFSDTYYLPQQNQLVAVQLFYPEYYQSLAVRLFNFDGKAVTPQQSVVVSYQEKVDRNGQRIRQITSVQPFTSYEAAVAQVASQKSANTRIMGVNPFMSPIPLEALTHYKLVHSSEQTVSQAEVGQVPEVKIFQYVP